MFHVIILVNFALAYCQDLIIRPRIIHGYSTDITDVPYQLMLTYKHEFTCGAVLISSRHVLTAAHCLYQDHLLHTHYIDIFAGVTHKSRRYREGHVYGVKEYIIHPLYFITKRDGDIAIINPSKQILVNHITVKPIKVTNWDHRPGYVAEISGWGLTDDRETLPDTIQIAKIRTRSCYWFVDSICSRGFSGICSGDSGGPLVHQNRLVGIARASISTTKDCTTYKEDLFTSVYFYRHFIHTFTRF